MPENIEAPDPYPQVSLADLEEIFIDNTYGSREKVNLRDSSGEAIDRYKPVGSFLDSENWKKYLAAIGDMAYRYSGFGPYEHTLQNFLSRLDRHGGMNLVPTNVMHCGYTFITRPRLNLSGANLKQHPVMNTLYSDAKDSIPFMIRALLDTKLCRGNPLFRKNQSVVSPNTEENMFSKKVLESGLVDFINPFMVPLCNALQGISGFPDFAIQEETTEGDFHSGDYTFAKGSDMNNRTQELSLEFKDVPGSVILSIFYYWCLVIALQAKGVMMAYPDDIYEQRLNYTVSIYRFVMDMAKQNVLWWAKATGCFPKSAPIGALFNVSPGDVHISSAMNFTIPFVANDVKVNDPGILMDFNQLMINYTGGNIRSDSLMSEIPMDNPVYNYNALPYIKADEWGVRLVWKASSIYEDVLPVRVARDADNKPVKDDEGNYKVQNVVMDEIDQKLRDSIKANKQRVSRELQYSWEDDDLSS